MRWLAKGLAFWYRLKLRWQFKGSKTAFNSYLKFCETDYFDKITPERHPEDEWDKIKARALADPGYRARNFSGWKKQIEEYRLNPPIPYRPAHLSKSVRQTILDSITELKTGVTK